MEQVGAWWGPVPAPTPDQPRRQTEAEVGVVAATGNYAVVVGEATWTRGPVGYGVLNHLRDVLRYVPGANQNTQLVLFAREFDTRLITRAADEGVLLVTPAELYAAAGQS